MLEPDLLVYYPGTRVWLSDANLDAIVIEVLISNGPHTMYKVSWWVGNDRKEQWVLPDELKHMNTDKVSIGFHAQQ